MAGVLFEDIFDVKDIAAPFMQTILHPCDLGTEKDESANEISTLRYFANRFPQYFTPILRVDQPYSKAFNRILKCAKPHFVLCLDRTLIEYRISNFVKLEGYWTTPSTFGKGKCSAAFISSSVGSTNNFSSVGDNGTSLSLGPVIGKNSLNLTTALSQ